MSAPHNETLRDLLNLLRASDDESAREPPRPRQDVGGPYRSERETLEAQVEDELTRLEHEQVLLNERRALIAAVRRASRPETFPRRFARTLAFGALLGAATSMATLFVISAPLLGHESRVSLRPPSEWRTAGEVERPSAPRVIYVPVANAAPTPRIEADVMTSVPHTIGSGITAITSTVWDVDRDVLVAALSDAPDSLRLVHDEHLGARLYGIRRASPAGQLGLWNGDELIAVDGVLVRDLMAQCRTRAAARRLAEQMTRNGRIELSLVRRGEPMTFTYLLR